MKEYLEKLFKKNKDISEKENKFSSMEIIEIVSTKSKLH